MRASPPLAPQGHGQDTYIVLDDFGPRLGRAWRETDEGAADRDTVIRNLLAGEYNSPVRIIAFNPAEGWSRDVTEDIANELLRLCTERDEFRNLSRTLFSNTLSSWPHANNRKAVMQKPAKAMSPLTINISSSQFDIGHLRNPAAPLPK
jgi:hypothetical protein